MSAAEWEGFKAGWTLAMMLCGVGFGVVLFLTRPRN